MRSYDPPLPIRVRPGADGRPVAFVWEGVTHAVESIEAVREPHLDWWHGPEREAHRTYFLVVTNRGMVAEVFRDEVAGEWFVGRRLD